MQNHDIIKNNGLRYLYIKGFDTDVLRRIEQADAVILDFQTKKTYNLLKLIRSHHQPFISLIPVVILHNSTQINFEEEEVSGPVKNASDYIIHSIDDIAETNAIVKELHNTCERFVTNPLSKDLEIINILRFIISRHRFKNRLDISINSKSVLGYQYPIVEFQHKKDDYKSILRTLERAVELELLLPTYKDTVHLCPNCLSGFHNIKEVCPSCRSANLESETTIHHYVCANISPMSEYVTSSGSLLCPQCDRYLKNIGIDYDKPSYIYHCDECDYQFQDPKMDAFCFHCETTSAVEELKRVKIYNYEVTKKGMYYSYSGKGVAQAEAESEAIVKDGYISRNTFITLFKLEKRKAMQEEKELISCTILIRTTNDIKTEIYDELCEEIKAITPEYVSLYETDRKFAFLFPDTVIFEDMAALYAYNAEHIKNWLRDKGIITTIKGSITSFKNQGNTIIKF